MSNPMIDPKKLCHIALVVSDIHKAADEWARLMGVESFPILRKGDFTEGGRPFQKTGNNYRGDEDFGNGPRYAWQEVDIRMNGFVLELIEPEQGPGPFREYYEKHGTGIHHIAFYNDACDECHDQLSADGYGYIVDTRNPANGDRWSVHDTEDALGTNLCIKPPRESLK